MSPERTRQHGEVRGADKAPLHFSLRDSCIASNKRKRREDDTIKQMKVLSFALSAVVVLSLLSTYAYAQGSRALNSPTAGSNPANLSPSPESAPSPSSKEALDTSNSVPVPIPVDTSDKTMSKWAEESVDWMLSNNIIPPQLQYNYKRFITREEFASLAVSVLKFMSRDKVNLIQTTIENKFKDTDSPDVATAYSFGIVNGASETEFKPKNNISRQEAAVMMSNLLQSIQTGGLSNEDYHYVDRLSIAGWALDAVDVTSNAKLFQGTDQGFRPGDNYTREQAILVMRKLLQVQGSAHEIAVRGKVLIDLDTLGTEEEAKSNKAKPISVIAGKSNVEFAWTETTSDANRLLDKLVIDLSGHESHHHEDTGVFVLTTDVLNNLKISTEPVKIGDYTVQTGATKKSDEGYLLQVTW